MLDRRRSSWVSQLLGICGAQPAPPLPVPSEGVSTSDAGGRVRRICATAPDARELRLRLLDELRGTVAFDAYAFVLTDPASCVGTSPLADVPMLHQLPRLIRLRYLTEVNRWTTLGESAVALLRAATDDAPSRSLLWRDLLDGHDIGDVASVVFRDRFGCWGFLELWRAGREARFLGRDAAMLSAIVEPVTQALRRTQASTFVLRSAPPRQVGPVVLLLSPELDVIGQTPDTHERLTQLVPPAPDRPPVPASAYNVAAQLLAVEAGVDTHPPYARVHLSDGLWLALRAARIGDEEPATDRNIAVTIAEAAAPERADVFARACGLSPRENELLGHLLEGCDSREIAARMFLSTHTVQDHLKKIFTKTGSGNRRALVSRALGRWPGRLDVAR